MYDLDDERRKRLFVRIGVATRVRELLDSGAHHADLSPHWDSTLSMSIKRANGAISAWQAACDLMPKNSSNHDLARAGLEPWITTKELVPNVHLRGITVHFYNAALHVLLTNAMFEAIYCYPDPSDGVYPTSCLFGPLPFPSFPRLLERVEEPKVKINSSDPRWWQRKVHQWTSSESNYSEIAYEPQLEVSPCPDEHRASFLIRLADSLSNGRALSFSIASNLLRASAALLGVLSGNSTFQEQASSHLLLLLTVSPITLLFKTIPKSISQPQILKLVMTGRQMDPDVAPIEHAIVFSVLHLMQSSQNLDIVQSINRIFSAVNLVKGQKWPDQNAMKSFWELPQFLRQLPVALQPSIAPNVDPPGASSSISPGEVSLVVNIAGNSKTKGPEDDRPFHAHGEEIHYDSEESDLSPPPSPCTTPEPDFAVASAAACTALSSCEPPIKRRRLEEKSDPVPLQQEYCRKAITIKSQWCRYCIRAQSDEAAEDCCRFKGIRVIPPAKDTPLFVSDRGEYPLHFSTAWHSLPTSSIICELQTHLSEFLLLYLEKEFAHSVQEKTCRVPRESDIRSTCEFCGTSVFIECYMCIFCGAELCVNCWMLLERRNRTGLLIGKRGVAAKKRLISCKLKGFKQHSRKCFIPITRFHSPELEDDVANIRACAVGRCVGPTSDVNPPGGDIQSDPSGTPGLPVPFFRVTEIAYPSFSKIFFRGIPVVITDILPLFSQEWTPQHFVNRHGTTECQLVDCEDETIIDATVEQFFSLFDKPKTNLGSTFGKQKLGPLKLKDWPPSEDFKNVFPELFQDFYRAVPFPELTRCDGPLNLASYFPQNVLAPDLGPKLYNAFASTELGAMGNTRLHMDVADAVNIMLYGDRAVWHIFPAESSNLVRQFLQEEFPPERGEITDPIHSQKHFLDIQLRSKLYNRYGVKCWRIEQRRGQAVFVPAGCAHQVCNLSDCIKIAADFVSPRNLEVYQRLAVEFRPLNYEGVWKEDILQIVPMAYFAWKNCEERKAKML